MARPKTPPDQMTVKELANAMHKDEGWMACELRKDSKRDIRMYPFAVASQNEETLSWNYYINRKRFERWNSGEDMGSHELVAQIVDKVDAIVRRALNGRESA